MINSPIFTSRNMAGATSLKMHGFVNMSVHFKKLSNHVCNQESLNFCEDVWNGYWLTRDFEEKGGLWFEQSVHIKYKSLATPRVKHLLY